MKVSTYSTFRRLLPPPAQPTLIKRLRYLVSRRPSPNIYLNI